MQTKSAILCGKILIFVMQELSIVFPDILLLFPENTYCTKRQYVKGVYLFVSSNHSPCYDRIEIPICTDGEVFDRLVACKLQC